MPRILGVDIPTQKRTDIALTYIYGVGRISAQRICENTSIDPATRAKDLTEDELSRLASVIENNYVVEGSLRRQVSQNIARLRDIGCYRGVRHRRSLPVRGQRTKTNARTRKGPKRMLIKKAAPPPK
ncbi:MAG: 30S ribosomal protein S13 [Planctomycetota bacterium]